MYREENIREFWHSTFAVLNPGRDFTVLFGSSAGKPAIALLQHDEGDAIETGDIQPVTKDGKIISVFVNRKI